MSTKVGLVMAYKGSNYGAQLQAYATQHIIESLGFETSIIDYRRKRFSISSIVFGPGILNYYINSRKERRIRQKTRVDIDNAVYLDNKKKRKEQLDSFINRRLHSIVKYTSYKKLEQDALSFSATLIGSDQKWLPGACYDKINALQFAGSNCKRVSYATSLGVSEYPSYCREMSKKMWDGIDSLSVREKTGADIVRKICGDGKRVEVVVDPTYLITKEEWEQLIPIEKKIDGEYVLCYFLGDDKESKICARKFCDAKGLKLVSIMSDESFSDIDISYADILIKGASPEDFVNIIRGASYVFTDSFHGVAFSVINNRQFYIFYRKRADAKLSRNSRIDDILKLWCVEDRLIVDKDRDWNSSGGVGVINYEMVNEVLIRERERSMFFLKNALSNAND
jgi:hypothetical protein